MTAVNTIQFNRHSLRIPPPNDSYKVTFSGISPDRVMSQAIMGLSPMLKGAVGFLRLKEGSGGNAHMQFIQDTSILWAPKALISRSKVELFEITLLEFIESGCFYYTPIMVGFLLAKQLQKFAPTGLKPSLIELQSPMKMVKGNVTSLAKRSTC